MRRSWLISILSLIVIIVVVGAGYAVIRRGVMLPGRLQKDAGSNTSDYSAVFLTNGQVYFGKIYSGPSDQVDLRNIYYLQVSQQIQPNNSSPTPTPADSSNNVVLVKLGNELHGPVDEMHINNSQVLFVESLKNDSKVVKAIADYQAK